MKAIVAAVGLDELADLNSLEFPICLRMKCRVAARDIGQAMGRVTDGVVQRCPAGLVSLTGEHCHCPAEGDCATTLGHGISSRARSPGKQGDMTIKVGG